MSYKNTDGWGYGGVSIPKRKKGKNDVSREDLNKAVEEFIKKGGKITKVEQSSDVLEGRSMSTGYEIPTFISFKPKTFNGYGSVSNKGLPGGYEVRI